MSIIAWNYRGLGTAPKVRKLEEMLREHSSTVLFLAETKCNQHRFEVVKQRLDLFGVCVPANGRLGSLAMLWQKQLVVQLRSFLRFHIDVEVLQSDSVSSWRCTGFYGATEVAQRKRQAPATVRARLDRACANPGWVSKFSRYKVKHLPASQSNHKVVLVDMNSSVTHRNRPVKKQFRFEARWLQSADCRGVVEKAWAEGSDGDVNMILWKKIQTSRVSLLKWNRLEFERPRCEIKKLEERYIQLAEGVLTEDRYSELQIIRSRLAENEARELLKWQQRSKEHWLANGDGNTRFSILEPRLGNMLILFPVLRIQRVQPSEANMDEVVSVVSRRVTSEMNSHLTQPFTATEVKRAPFGMFPFKSPGPNGNRLKSVMNDIVSPTQSAFIPGRLITDNVLLAFELNHFLRASSRAKKGYVALKLDMSKAYDRVEWPFLRRILLRLGFESGFVRLIMLLVTSVSYSLTLNGTYFGYFKPKQGIRQGDPLSPYLFIFCAEAFSSLIQAAERRRKLQGVRINPSAPSISHLLFADDTLLFCQAMESQIEEIWDILVLYARASSQEINFLKSSMVVNGAVGDERRKRLADRLGVQLVSSHDWYLGLPAVAGRSRRTLFRNIRSIMGANRWMEQQALVTSG
ncbi:UNVERIFIED_CONTAM: LINE-1 retrotransposable element O protein [Sesamum radiatum]|uniref:LINE-1 retrotransposable element O protein n=1 Tax=Sesamum radiatum TaxID=300843 RepID=A0AAW2PPC0_SESRA